MGRVSYLSLYHDDNDVCEKGKRAMKIGRELEGKKATHVLT